MVCRKCFRNIKAYDYNMSITAGLLNILDASLNIQCFCVHVFNLHSLFCNQVILCGLCLDLLGVVMFLYSKMFLNLYKIYTVFI